MIPTGWQIREGRQLAGLSRADLAAAAGIGLAPVVDAELTDHEPVLTGAHAAALRTALKAGGVEFVQEDGGIGVQRLQVGL